MAPILGDFINVSYEVGTITSPIGVMDTFNNFTGGIGFMGIILAIWFILFLTLKSRDTEDSLIVASFICIILSGILFFAGLVDNSPIKICVALLGIGIISKLTQAWTL